MCASPAQASLVVNVASHSEQTELNYRSLQELHRELGTSHFNVLAFPCGQFGDTETGTSRDIEAFAKATYGVTFPFFSRIKIMGSEADPAFRFLTGQCATSAHICALCQRYDCMWSFSSVHHHYGASLFVFILSYNDESLTGIFFVYKAQMLSSTLVFINVHPLDIRLHHKSNNFGLNLSHIRW